MKIVVWFFVVAVSSCSGLGTSLLPASNLNGVNDLDVPDVSALLQICLIKTLKGSQELLLRFALLICTYEKGVGKLNDDNWKAFYTSLQETVAATACQIDTMLDITVVKELANPTSQVTIQLLETLRPILDKSGLSKTAFEAACDLTERFLVPTCVPLLVGGDVSLLLIDLATQACPGINKKVAYDDLLRIVKRTSCLISDAPLDLDGVVSDISQNANGDLVYSAAAKPFGDLIVDVLCTAAKILLPGLFTVTAI